MVNRIVGTPDSDTLAGGPGEDLILGKAGNDVLRHGEGGGRDTLRGGGGNDQIFISGQTDEPPVSQTAMGDGGNDTIYFGWGADTVLGGAGNDSFYWNGNFRRFFSEEPTTDLRPDVVEGGNGNDFLSLPLGGLILGEVRLDGAASGTRSLTLDGELAMTIRSVESILLTLPPGASLTAYTGGSGFDLLTLDLGQHRANTGAGDDAATLTLDGLRDVIDLGGGDDRLRLTNAGAQGDTVFDMNDDAVMVGGEELASVTGVQRFESVATSASNEIRVTGTSKANDIFVAAGELTVDAGGGDDELVVGIYDRMPKTLHGGAGFDELQIGFAFLGLDTGTSFRTPQFGDIDMTGTRGTRVKVSVNGDEVLDARSIEQLFVFASPGNDRLIGMDLDDILSGGEGDDTILGKGGMTSCRQARGRTS